LFLSVHKETCAWIYEIRVYEAVDGKADAMKARFKDMKCQRFPPTASSWLGVFESATEGRAADYLTRFKSEDDRSKAWASFGADPEFGAR